MRLKIIAALIAFYSLGGLVGGLMVAAGHPRGVLQLAFAAALLLGSYLGARTASWLWQRSPRAPVGIRGFGFAFLLAVLMLPATGPVRNPVQAVVAIVLGAVLWLMLIAWLAHWVAGEIGMGAA